MLLVARSWRFQRSFISAYLLLGPLPVPAGDARARVSSHASTAFMLRLFSTSEYVFAPPTDGSSFTRRASKQQLSDVYFSLRKIPISRVNHPHHVEHGEMESADSVDS